MPDTPRLETPARTVERLMRAVGDILKTADHCIIGRDRNGFYQAIPPFTARRWTAAPQVYGRIIIEHVTKATTAGQIGCLLYGTRFWRNRKAA